MKKTKIIEPLSLEEWNILEPNSFFDISFQTQVINKPTTPDNNVKYTLLFKIKDGKDLSLIQKEFNEEFKKIINLSFCPYNYQSKTYQFFTTIYQTKEVKKNILHELNELIKKYEIILSKKQEIVPEQINQLKKDYIDFETINYHIKFNDKINDFLLLVKNNIDRSSYIELLKMSHYVYKTKSKDEIKPDSNLLSCEEVNNFFKLKKNKNYSVFQFKQDKFPLLLSFIESEKNNFSKYSEEQNNIMKIQNEQFQKIVFTDKNLSDFYININEEFKCFEFYCKGYSDNSYSGMIASKSSFQNLLNYEIFCTIFEDPFLQKNEQFFKHYNQDFYKIELSTIGKNGNNLLVPFSEYEKLQFIFNNFFKIKPIIENTIIKKTFYCEDYSITSQWGADLTQYPFTFLEENNKKFLGLKFQIKTIFDKNLSKEVSEEDLINLDFKNQKKIKYKIDFWGVEVKQNDFNYFMEKSHIHNKIKENSLLVACNEWQSHSYTRNDMIDIYEKYKLKNLFFENSDYIENKIKQKKNKI